MKKLLVVAILAVGMLWSSSCSNEFDLVDTWKDIPVVYGLLSRADTAIYVRVEKAFLDPEQSALEIAQIPDSLYYPDATVKLVRLNNNQEYNLQLVDGNLDGYPREEGVFADAPNWLYKLTLDEDDELREGERYEIIVNRDEASDPVTGRAVVVSDLEFQEPVSTALLRIEYDKDLDMRWKFDRDDAIFFDAYLHFHYIEVIDGEDVDKSFTWQVGSNLTNEENAIRKEIDIPGVEFYQTVGNRIDETVNVPRKIKFVELEVIAGGQEFFDYLQVNNANRGITSSQVIPNFTNLSEGYGLFSSVNKVTQIHLLDLITRDSLIDGIYTKNLNFQD